MSPKLIEASIEPSRFNPPASPTCLKDDVGVFPVGIFAFPDSAVSITELALAASPILDI